MTNLRSARGRANRGQQRRRRRSPPADGTGAGAGSPPHKRVMDNVVILRRGQQIPLDKATAPPLSVAPATVARKPETAPAGKDAGAAAAAATRGEQEKVDAKESSSESEKRETAAAVDQRGAQEEAAAETADNIGTTETKEEEEPAVATDQSGPERTAEDGEPKAAAAGQSGAQAVAAVDQRGPDSTRERKKKAEAAEGRAAADDDAMKAAAVPAAAAHQTLPLAKEQAYSGASFAAVAPDPRALPVPVLLLKPRCRSARIRVHAPHNDRALAPTAAAA